MTAKHPKRPEPTNAVRTRRAYFDCRFGQLHVRTAFPTTGGFDEQVTLFCLHSERSSSRAFARFLPEIGDVRSVYAPDLPGCIAGGFTFEETAELMRGAIAMHLRCMREDGDPIPEPTTKADYMEAPAA